MEVRREWQMGHEDIGVRKGDCSFEPLSIGGQAALSDAVRGLVN
jgi:hypothetical protein